MRKAFVVFFLLALVGCTGTTLTYEDVLEEINTIDEAHDTSLWTQTLREGIEEAEIPGMLTDLEALEQKVAAANAPSEKEKKTNVNLVEARIQLVKSRESYINYVNRVKEGASCAEPETMHEALFHFERAINATFDAGYAWDRALNAHPPAQQALSIEQERPAFFDIKKFDLREDYNEFKGIVDQNCPLG